MAEELTYSLILEAIDKASEIFAMVGEATEKFEARAKKSLDAAGKDMDQLEGKVKSSAEGIEGDMGKMADAHEQADGRIRGSLGNIGANHAKLLSAVGVVGGGIAMAAIDIAKNSMEAAQSFQESTATLAANAQIPIPAATAMGNAFINSFSDTTIGAQKMIDAIAPVSGELEVMTGHSLTTKDAVALMSASYKDAEASGGDLNQTTKILTDTMKVFHQPLSDAAQVGDVLFNTSRGLGESMQQLGGQIARIEPRMLPANMSLKQMAGFMLEVSGTAGTGRQAMSLMTQAVMNLAQPTTAAKTALEKMGVTLTDSTGKFIGMPAAIDRLHNALMKMPDTNNAVAASNQLLADKQTMLVLSAELAGKSITGQQQALALLGPKQELARLTTENQTAAIKKQETELKQQIALVGLHGQASAASSAQIKEQIAVLQAHDKQLTVTAGDLTKNSALQAIFRQNVALGASIVAQGSAGFNKYTQAVSESGTASDAAEKEANTMRGAHEKLDNTIKGLQISIGESLLPTVQKMFSLFAQVLTPILSWITAHRTLMPLILGTAAVIGTLIAVGAGFILMAKYINGVKDAFSIMHSLFKGKAPEIGESMMETSATTQEAADQVTTSAEQVTEAADQMQMSFEEVAAGGDAMAEQLQLDFDTIDAASEETGAVMDGLPVIAIISAILIIGGLLISHWQEVKRVAEDVWHAVAGFFEHMWTDVKHWFDDGIKWVEKNWKYLVQALIVILTGGIGVIVALVWDNWTKIKQISEDVWNALVGFFKAVWREMVDAFTSTWNAILGAGEAVWHALVSAFEWTWNTIRNVGTAVWTAVKNYFVGQWNGFVGEARGIWDDVVNGIKDAWSGLEDAASAVWNTVGQFFADGVNGAIELINTFIRALDLIPGVNISTIGFVSFSGSGGGAGTTAGLASGGITHGPQVLVGEGNPAYPEAVIPTDPRYRSNAMQLMGWVSGQIGAAQGGIVGLHSGGLIGDIVSTVTGAIGSVTGPIADTAISTAEHVAYAGVSHLPYPASVMGRMAVNSIGDAVKTMIPGAASGGVITPSSGGSITNTHNNGIGEAHFHIYGSGGGSDPADAVREIRYAIRPYIR